jgi:hypothetical protein
MKSAAAFAAYSALGRSSGVLIRAREIQHHARLVPEGPGIVSRRDYHGVVGADLDLRAIIHPDAHPSREHVPYVRNLATLGARDRLYALRPLSARLEDGPADVTPSRVTTSILPLSNALVSSGESRLLPRMLRTGASIPSPPFPFPRAWPTIHSRVEQNRRHARSGQWGICPDSNKEGHSTRAAFRLLARYGIGADVLGELGTSGT